MRLGHRRVDRAQLNTSLIEGHTRSEATEKFGHAMHTAGDHGRGEVVGAGNDVADNFSILRVWDGGFENADDGSGAIAHRSAAEAKGFTENSGIFSERGGPERVGKNDDARGV